MSPNQRNNGIEEKNFGKLKEEDRRFLMGVINQNVQILQSQGQFKLNSLLSYTAIYLSIIAVLNNLNDIEKISPYLYIVTAIFIIAIFSIFVGKKESKLIKNQTSLYQKFKEAHFAYLKGKRPK